MATLNISQLSEFTGRDRETVTRRLRDLPFTTPNGSERGGKFYDAQAALEAIFGAEARTDEKTELQRVRRETAELQRDTLRLELETKRRERILVADVEAVLEMTFGNMRAAIIRTDGTQMNQEAINQLLGELRGVAKWIAEQKPAEREVAP